MLRYLNWQAAEGGLERDGRWSCGTHDYPSMHHSLMHPCANKESNCCGDSRTAPILLRYESFFHSKNALLVLAYEVGCARLPWVQGVGFQGLGLQSSAINAPFVASDTTACILHRVHCKTLPSSS